MAVHQLSCTRTSRADNRVEQCGLASTIATEQTDTFTRFHDKCDVAQGLSRTEIYGEALHDENWIEHLLRNLDEARVARRLGGP